MDVEGEAAASAPAAPKKTKIVKKKDVPFVSSNTALDKSVLDKYVALEAEMHASDKLVQDTEVC